MSPSVIVPAGDRTPAAFAAGYGWAPLIMEVQERKHTLKSGTFWSRQWGPPQWSSKNILMTMPKNLEISGTSRLQLEAGKRFFGLLSGDLHIEGIGTKINPVSPSQFS